MKHISLWALAALVLTMPFLFTNCGMKKSGQAQANSAFFFSTMTEMVVDVFYESETPGDVGDLGAKPYTTNAAGTFHYWNIVDANIKEVFKNRPVTFKIPKQLSEMTAIADQNKSSWTVQDIYSLASSLQKAPENSTQSRFTIVFVNGYAANSDGSPNPSTIGFQITGTTMIVVFKDVVRSTGVHPSGFVPKYVEQSTLVHELGHAIGLVNNGLSMKSNHQDHAHGAHCSNSNCVMHYLNEGKDDLVDFVTQFTDTQTPILFGAECLHDTTP